MSAELVKRVEDYIEELEAEASEAATPHVEQAKIAIAARLREILYPDPANRPHKLGCDEAHAHQAPDCCRSDCWCLQDGR